MPVYCSSSLIILFYIVLSMSYFLISRPNWGVALDAQWNMVRVISLTWLIKFNWLLSGKEYSVLPAQASFSTFFNRGNAFWEARLLSTTSRSITEVAVHIISVHTRDDADITIGRQKNVHACLCSCPFAPPLMPDSCSSSCLCLRIPSHTMPVC